MSENESKETEIIALKQALQQLQEECDKARAARDAVIQEVLVSGGQKNTSLPSHFRRLWLLLVVLLCLGVCGYFIYRTMQLGRRINSRSAISVSRTAPRSIQGTAVRSEAHSGWPVSRRLVQIPLIELDRLGRSALHPDGHAVAVTSADGKLGVFNLIKNHMEVVVKAHQGQVRDVEYTPSGRFIVTAGIDGALIMWDADSGRKEKIFHRQKTPIERIAISSRFVAVASEQPDVEIFALDTGELQQRLKGQKGWVRAVAFSPHKPLLATGDEAGNVRVWSTVSWKVIHSYEGHRLWISAVSFNHDGTRLASADYAKQIFVWDTHSGKLLQRFVGHQRAISDLAFDPQSELLASASLDRTACLWNTKSGVLVARILGHQYKISSVVFHPTGKALMTTSTDNSLGLWPLPLPTPPMWSMLPPPKPGEVTFRRNTTGERIRVKLVDTEGQLQNDALAQVAELLRSAADDKTLLPDAKLMKLLYRVVHHFGRHHEVIVISGYRSPKYNQLRTRQSSQVGKESLHQFGKALDFRLGGITITALHAYVKSLKAGGVGFYADSNFVHMDVGPVRTWQGS